MPPKRSTSAVQTVMKKRMNFKIEQINTILTETKLDIKSGMSFTSVMIFMMQKALKLGITNTMTFIKNENTQKVHINH
jgi:hypothetical protein